MEPVSSVIYKTLMRQAIANGRGGARDGRGIGAGVPKGDRTHPLTAQAGEEVTASRYENEKRTPAEPAPVNREEKRQNSRTRLCGEPFLRLVADNVDVVPTRQRRGIARLSLVRT